MLGMLLSRELELNLSCKKCAPMKRVMHEDVGSRRPAAAPRKKKARIFVANWYITYS